MKKFKYDYHLFILGDNVVRKTVTINDALYNVIQAIRGKFIGDRIFEDMSFSTALNMILLGGIAGCDDFDEETWKTIRSFLAEEKEKIDLEGFKERLKELREMIVEREAIIPEPATKVCPRCKAYNDPNALFCNQCVSELLKD